MSNIFKTNNRFACLIDNNYETRNHKNKVYKKDNDYKRDTDYKRDNDYKRDTDYKRDNDYKNEFKKAEVHELTLDNFPSLTTPIEKNTISTNNINTNITTYIDKLKIEQIHNTDVDEKYIQPGWIVIEKNTNNKTVFNRNKHDEHKDKHKKEEDYDCNQIIDNLIYNHTKFVDNYIESWGEDEYEKIFLFTNYEYGYFDRLDQEYEEYMEELEQQKMEQQHEIEDEYD